MIVIRVIGTPNDTTDIAEKVMQEITKGLRAHSRLFFHEDAYLEFPMDRMQMDLGTEIVVQIFGANMHNSTDKGTGLLIRGALSMYFPKGTKIGVQMIEARTALELTPQS